MANNVYIGRSNDKHLNPSMNLPGTLIPSTYTDNIDDFFIHPYPIVESRFLYGGYREVPTINDRDFLSIDNNKDAFLEDGCICYVRETNKEYRWNANDNRWDDVHTGIDESLENKINTLWNEQHKPAIKVNANGAGTYDARKNFSKAEGELSFTWDFENVDDNDVRQTATVYTIYDGNTEIGTAKALDKHFELPGFSRNAGITEGGKTYKLSGYLLGEPFTKTLDINFKLPWFHYATTDSELSDSTLNTIVTGDTNTHKWATTSVKLGSSGMSGAYLYFIMPANVVSSDDIAVDIYVGSSKYVNSIKFVKSYRTTNPEIEYNIFRTSDMGDWNDISFTFK
jgi:hypothetical protein